MSTRVLSAAFREGSDVTSVVEELKVVLAPAAGYFKAGGVYMSSIVAEIGSVVGAAHEEHRADP